MTDELVLEMRGIRKEFPGIVANDNVDLDIRRGEVHALLGENGAGKSTLMNILYGLYRPDAGEILLNGKPVEFSSARDAIGAGIGMVHQHFMLIPVMTVAENIVLGVEPRHNLLLDERTAERRVRELSERFGLAVDPTALVSDITVGQEQRVEILKALYRGADILILDEPTAVLTPQEARELFEIIRSLQADGKSIIFISHKLNEVLEIADRITVLRRGKKIETVSREGATEASLARAMVGREVLLRVEKTPAQPGEVLLAVKDLHVSDDRGIEKVRGVSFEVRAGEIVGIAGVDGNGQTELIDAITGLLKSESGDDQRRRAASCATRARATCSTRASATSRKTASAAGSCSSSRSRRTSRCTTTHSHPSAKWGWLFPRRLVERARKPHPRVRRPRRRTTCARRRPVGRQPAEGRAGARDRTRPEGPDRRPADARPRRRRDRVPAPADRHRARRGTCRAARLARARGDPFALRPDPRHLRGRDRRRAYERRLRAGDRPRDARWAGASGRVTTDPTPPPETPQEAAETGTIAARFAVKQRAGGIAVPVFTGVLAFLIGGLVVLATGHNPLLAYRDIFNGAGLNWIFHPTTNIASTAAYNLSQTLLQTTTLILCGLAVAFAFRCGMFNIGGQGQYLVGLYVANWLGYDLAGMSPLPHILIAVARRHARGRRLGGHRRLPEGDRRRARGDLHDHAQLDRDLGRHLALR